jgi:hypothetical protein
LIKKVIKADTYSLIPLGRTPLHIAFEVWFEPSMLIQEKDKHKSHELVNVVEKVSSQLDLVECSLESNPLLIVIHL